MKCKEVLRLLPLLVGEDLPPARAKKAMNHLDTCSRCREEFETYRLTHRAGAEWLNRETAEWNEFEWQRCVRNAVERGKPAPGRVFGHLFKPGFAAAAVAAVGILVGLFFIFNPLSRVGPAGSPGSSGTPAAKVAALPTAAVAGDSQQMIAMNIVSPKTGLKIHWVLNKNFHWEENK